MNCKLNPMDRIGSGVLGLAVLGYAIWALDKPVAQYTLGTFGVLLMIGALGGT